MSEIVEEQNKGLVEKLKDGFKDHLVGTTALLASTNPLYSAMEVGIAGMSDKVSIDSRLTVAALSYGGMGFVFNKGRDFSRRIFKITGETKERIQTLHDFLYAATFNLAITPPIYLLMGADGKQAILGGLSAAAFSIVMGPIMGYSVDVARDLTGLEKCERASYPDLVRRQKSSFKKGLAGMLVAGSVAAMAGIYALTPDREDYQMQSPSISEIRDDK